MESVERFEHAGRIVEIYPDQDEQGPDGWDNAGTLVIDSSLRMTFGDEQRHATGRTRDDDWMVDVRLVQRQGGVALPVFFADYGSSGARIYESDHDPNGVIYATREEIAEEWGGDKDKAAEYLRGRLATYTQWMEGDVYGYVVSDEAGNHLDSCWGFYGFDYAVAEAREAAEYHAPPKPCQMGSLLLPA
jgi:hypothetical protein